MALPTIFTTKVVNIVGLKDWIWQPPSTALKKQYLIMTLDDVIQQAFSMFFVEQKARKAAWPK